MKIAGRKNDGAWFRLNKELKAIRDGANPNEIYDLSTAMAGGGHAAAAFAAMNALSLEAGVTPPEAPANASAWCARMVEIGIPRQVWYGRLTFTTYFKTAVPEEENKWYYKANHQTEFHAFGKHVRKVCKVWHATRRAIKDLTDTGLANQGNPGGQPDAEEGN